MADSADVLTNHVRETWDRSAEIYADKVAPAALGYRLILETGYVKEGSRVLDIGCGPGNFTAAYAEVCAEVVGVDLAPNMIGVAAKQYPHIAFQTANVEELPFDDESFDVVVSGYVNQYLARPEVAFREVSRVLRPGGRFIFVVPTLRKESSDGVQEAQSLFGGFFSALEEHHVRESVPAAPLRLETDPRVHERMLTENGFDGCQVGYHEMTSHLSSLDPFIEGQWQIANLRRLPKDLQSKIEASTRRNAERCRTDDGSYAFPHTVLLGTAVK